MYLSFTIESYSMWLLATLQAMYTSQHNYKVINIEYILTIQ